jgi:hypothetical protein
MLALGATPILLSLTVRDLWKEGRVERGSGRFGDWTREVATSQRVAPNTENRSRVMPRR